MTTRNSLRAELLFNLAFLAAAAVVLALVAARAIQRSGLSFPVVWVVVVAALFIFLLLGNHLVQRWVLRPLDEISKSATSIAAGEISRRIPEEGPTEIAALAAALNRLTEQLLHNQTLLAENVRSLDETNLRLNEAQHELVQAEKMASLGQLAAGVAHEIGNPLGAILGYVSLHKRRGDAGELVEGMEREARRIDRIVRDLLDYARPSSATREEVDISAAVLRVVDLLRDQGWLERVTLDLQLPPDLPGVIGDPHRIDQIFVNLLRNAETAMEGAGTLSVRVVAERYRGDQPVPIRRADDPPGINYSHLRRRAGRVSPKGRALTAGRETIHVTIADTGPGISDEMIQSIFDPFFTTRGPGEGTGLGLAIVAGSVADLGGRIEAGSNPEGGALFNIWFPTGEADPS